MSKEDKRNHFKAILGLIDNFERQSQSLAACGQLCQTELFRRATSTLFYLAMPSEISLEMAMQQAFDMGKTVLVPSVNWETKEMFAIRLSSMDCEMETCRYGLKEPVEKETYPISNIELVIVPALGYDIKGYRLGRGGGFYDRFLARQELQATTCGFVFEDQVTDSIPIDQHDVAVDMIVTDQQVRLIQ